MNFKNKVYPPLTSDFRRKRQVVEDFDRIVSAELPDPLINPLAYKTVTKFRFMVPVECVSECVCKKKYSKQFCEVK